MSKRIGILTRHCYPNYGSLLQTIALSNALSGNGSEASVIDYVPPSDTVRGLPAASLRESRLRESTLGRVAYLGLQTPNLTAMALRFRRFQRNSLELTDVAHTTEELERVGRPYDAIVVGSDQVWNRIHGQIDPNYYLAGTSEGIQKYSYAASFGSGTIPDGEEMRIRTWLTDFADVSVRESDAVDALANCGIAARRDVDPVILQTRDFWEEYAQRETSEKPTAPYILIYRLHNTPGFASRVEELKQRTQLNTRFVSVDALKCARALSRDYLVPPQKFVQLIADAACVVTDSFHGTAFSLIFGRPLLSVLPSKYSSRSSSLLKDVGLEHLGVAESEPTPSDLAYDDRKVSALLAELRAPSLEYVERLTS